MENQRKGLNSVPWGFRVYDLQNLRGLRKAKKNAGPSGDAPEGVHVHVVARDAAPGAQPPQPRVVVGLGPPRDAPPGRGEHVRAAPVGRARPLQRRPQRGVHPELPPHPPLLLHAADDQRRPRARVLEHVHTAQAAGRPVSTTRVQQECGTAGARGGPLAPGAKSP